MEWQPIETAPKNGRWVLSTYCGGIIAIRWRPDIDPDFPWDGFMLDTHIKDARNGYLDGTLDYWMPLPEPPGGEK